MKESKNTSRYQYSLNEGWIDQYDLSSPLQIEPVAYQILYNTDITIEENDVIAFWEVYKVELLAYPEHEITRRLGQIHNTAEHRGFQRFLEILDSGSWRES